MRQADLNREVARATGETVSAVKRLCFLLDEPLACSNPDCEELGPRFIDWDQLEADRYAETMWENYDPAAA